MPTDTPSPPTCPFCGERQSRDEARPSKPILSQPRLEWRRGGRFVTVRDTYWHTHCRSCDERIIWSVSAFPVAGIQQWVKP